MSREIRQSLESVGNAISVENVINDIEHHQKALGIRHSSFRPFSLRGIKLFPVFL